jgi:hypothetical protein
MHVSLLRLHCVQLPERQLYAIYLQQPTAARFDSTSVTVTRGTSLFDRNSWEPNICSTD